ncbi:hypothetical protein TWF694_008706 [Orbilia ellipsospora]|uniref:Uncharacterized protein n=1 Tax=Orbilia ellipsospora TaxID=2528407 RepID=A0AAV9XCU7_9PEZI
MCLTIVLGQQKKTPKREQSSSPPPLQEPANGNARMKKFFDTRSGRWFTATGIDDQGDEEIVIRAAPAPQQTMRRPKKTTFLIEAPPVSRPKGKAVPLRRNTSNSSRLGLEIPAGRGFSSPRAAVEAAMEAGLNLEGKNVHLMPGEQGGYFVVGVSDI